MSDLIDKLAEQATDNILGVPVLDKRKFAELIVRECSAYVEGTGNWLVAMEMKQHFGVKE